MTIRASSPFIFAGPDSSPYITQNGAAAGMVRYNTSNQQLEAYDGSIWHRIVTNENVGLTHEAVEAIHWARKKIEEEAKLKALAEKHPGVADAMAELKRASEQLEIMVQLVNQDRTPVA
jgi:flagellar hook-basal body complex protein FliE